MTKDKDDFYEDPTFKGIFNIPKAKAPNIHSKQSGLVIGIDPATDEGDVTALSIKKDGRVYMFIDDDAEIILAFVEQEINKVLNSVKDSLPEELPAIDDETDPDYFYGLGNNSALKEVKAVIEDHIQRGSE